ncbi:MAG: hypothetical protein WC780_13050 [Lentimicrobiaceae bacterium]|jgi:hypothetical protein
MNKLITVLFILLISDCNAATGNASDGQLLAIVVIGLILLIVGTGYFIDLMKSKLKEFRKRRLIKRNNFDKDSEFLNSFNKAIPELDGISTF